MMAVIYAAELTQVSILHSPLFGHLIFSSCPIALSCG